MKEKRDENVRMTICLAVVVLFMTAGQGFGVIEYKDGEIHNISSTINDDMWVDYLAPGMQTIVNLLNGGSIPRPNKLQGYNDSRINISSGLVDFLYANDFSTVNISSGGYVYQLYDRNSSTVNISGGSVYSLFAQGTSIVNISGGNIRTFSAYDSSTVNISGGNVSIYLAVDHSSKVNISGGSMGHIVAYGSSVTNISNGFVARLSALDSSTVKFHGQNFSHSSGLTFDGNRVLGTGDLFGEWMDGTHWVVSIINNYPTATILTVLEKPTCKEKIPSDINNDCKVDFADFAIMASEWLHDGIE